MRHSLGMRWRAGGERLSRERKAGPRNRYLRYHDIPRAHSIGEQIGTTWGRKEYEDGIV